jgi:hypothetical protein
MSSTVTAHPSLAVFGRIAGERKNQQPDASFFSGACVGGIVQIVSLGLLSAWIGMVVPIPVARGTRPDGARTCDSFASRCAFVNARLMLLLHAVNQDFSAC